MLATAATLVISLALVAPAMAKGGEGTYGKYDDKVVTNFGYGLMIFFTSISFNLFSDGLRSAMEVKQ